MNKYAKNHTSKGISVEGFWRQIKTKTETKPGETERSSSPDLADPNLSELKPQPHIDSRDMSRPDEDWIARFDEWLDRP